MNKKFITKFIPWILLLVVVAGAFMGWGSARNWEFDNLGAYSIFPLLGILAWSIMWTHYTVGAMTILDGKIKPSKAYSKFTNIVVLVLLLLHPGLLYWKQWSVAGYYPLDGAINYVGEPAKWAVFAGMLALIIFLSFEFFNRMQDRVFVKNNWKWISLSQIFAMTLIFFHALKIGNTTNSPAFELYWVILGAALIPCFGLVLRNDFNKK